MVVSLEDELIPLVRLSPVLQEVIQTHPLWHLQIKGGPSEIVQSLGEPVTLEGISQDSTCA
jgi:hypothetical protein